jgi:outer membrane protein
LDAAVFSTIKILQGDICMHHIHRRLTIAASMALSGTVAAAQTTPWSIHVGPAAVNLHVSTSPEAPRGTPIPGGGLSATNSNILAFELAYEIAPNWNARLTAGIPPTTVVHGIGALAPLGKAGEIKYGPAVMSITRALGNYGAVTPYAGAGVSYLKVFSTVDGALANFAVKNSWGKVLQLGADLALGPRFGLFLDMKKIYQSTDVTGTVPAFGGAPAYAKVRIDPFVVQLGVSYRF